MVRFTFGLHEGLLLLDEYDINTFTDVNSSTTIRQNVQHFQVYEDQIYWSPCLVEFMLDRKT